MTGAELSDGESDVSSDKEVTGLGCVESQYRNLASTLNESWIH